MIFSFLFALAGCLLTGAQTLLIILQGKGICLNDGCDIVDSLTTVPPLFINIAGFSLFLLVTIGLSQARRGSETWKRFVSLLLLAALAAEAVLVAFQYLIAEIFCSYCLIILGLIVLANLFMGIKQIFKGVVIFSAVSAAFFSVDFKAGSASSGSLHQGSIARLAAGGGDRQLYLFFSSSCTYCERIIEQLRTETTCSVNFNPIDPIESFEFSGAVLNPAYVPEINRNFLRHLGIEEIPALASTYEGVTTVMKGERTISNYLELNCTAGQPAESPSTSSLQGSSYSDQPATLEQDDESCSVLQDCDEPSSSPADPANSFVPVGENP